MGKNGKFVKHSQYDEDEEQVFSKKKSKPKKKESDFEFLGEMDFQKQRTNNRYENRKKDKRKYDNDDEYEGWY